MRYPIALPSPEIVFKWRRGDSFDLSLALCSLLIGNGLDAYCVCGYAPKWITQRDCSKQPCPYLQQTVESTDVKEVEVKHFFW